MIEKGRVNEEDGSQFLKGDIRDQGQHHLRYHITAIVWLSFLCCVLNPIVIIVFNRKFRSEVRGEREIEREGGGGEREGEEKEGRERMVS